MSQKIAVVVGVGAENGLGAALCRKAAAQGRHVAVAGRTPEKLDRIVKSLMDGGASASAHRVDVTEEGDVEALFGAVDGLAGDLDVVCYNAGNSHTHDTLTMSADFFEGAWRVCCLGGLLVGREALKRLSANGKGSLLFTGATASLRSRPPYIPFASAKAGLRAVAAGMAREFGPAGVHVAHFIIDGGIEGERLLSRNPALKDRMGENGMLSPEAIADTYWTIHEQHPSAWSFEVDLRPFKETF